MAVNILKCNCLTPLYFKGLKNLIGSRQSQTLHKHAKYSRTVSFLCIDVHNWYSLFSQMHTTFKSCIKMSLASSTGKNLRFDHKFSHL